uniref:Uncharacterized protein n=1 Tax=Trichogramma kaykai TaxID=54128 RepID=A0ABD2VWR5_9HYME
MMADHLLKLHDESHVNWTRYPLRMVRVSGDLDIPYISHSHVTCAVQQRQHQQQQQQQQEFKWKYRLLLRSIEGRRRRSGGGGDGGGAEEEGMRDRCRASNDTILRALDSR